MSLTHRLSAFYLRARKALHGAILATVPVLLLVTQADSAGGDVITRNEWLMVGAAALGIGSGVYATRNRNA